MKASSVCWIPSILFGILSLCDLVLGHPYEQKLIIAALFAIAAILDSRLPSGK